MRLRAALGVACHPQCSSFCARPLPGGGGGRPSGDNIGSVPDCRVVSQVSTVAGAVQCCDSCRAGLLLRPQLIQASTGFLHGVGVGVGVDGD